MAYIWVFDYDDDGDVIMGSGRQEFVDESYLSGTDDDDDDDDDDDV